MRISVTFDCKKMLYKILHSPSLFVLLLETNLKVEKIQKLIVERKRRKQKNKIYKRAKSRIDKCTGIFFVARVHAKRKMNFIWPRFTYEFTLLSNL